MTETWIPLFGGLILLVAGGELLVRGAVQAAERLCISPLVIGLTLVGFGTSMPELVTSVQAGLNGSPGIAYGNVVGSNIANIALVLGITAIIAPLPVKSGVLRKELPLLLAVTVFAGMLLLDLQLTIVDSAVLLSMLALSLYLFQRFQRNASPEESASEEEELPELKTGNAIFWLLLGLVILAGSSRLLVWGATEVALALGVSELIIGLTIVAIGTSLPELAASVTSALKGHHDLAIGNVVGSNIFNLVAVMAVPGLIAPLSIDSIVLLRDYSVMLGLTVALIAFGLIQKPPKINRYEGVLLTTLYAGYLVLLYNMTV